jgi:hypothetical protein
MWEDMNNNKGEKSENQRSKSNLTATLGARVFLPRFSSFQRNSVAFLAIRLRISRSVSPLIGRWLVKAQVLHMFQLPGHFLLLLELK